MKGKSYAATPPSMNDYQTEDDVRTLHAAHKIKKDKKRHAAAKKHAATMAAGMKAVADDSAIDGKPEPDEDDATPASIGKGMGKAPASSKFTD